MAGLHNYAEVVNESPHLMKNMKHIFGNNTLGKRLFSLHRPVGINLTHFYLKVR